MTPPGYVDRWPRGACCRSSARRASTRLVTRRARSRGTPCRGWGDYAEWMGVSKMLMASQHAAASPADKPAKFKVFLQVYGRILDVARLIPREWWPRFKRWGTTHVLAEIPKMVNQTHYPLRISTLHGRPHCGAITASLLQMAAARGNNPTSWRTWWSMAMRPEPLGNRLEAPPTEDEGSRALDMHLHISWGRMLPGALQERAPAFLPSLSPHVLPRPPEGVFAQRRAGQHTNDSCPGGSGGR